MVDLTNPLSDGGESLIGSEQPGTSIDSQLTPA